MFESPSASSRSSFSARGRVAVLGSAVGFHLVLLGSVVVASVWRIVPLPAPEPTEAYISVSLPPLDVPVTRPPRPPVREAGGKGGALRTPAVAETAPVATRALVQPTTADLPTATPATLDGQDASIHGTGERRSADSGEGDDSGESVAGEGDARPIPVAGAVIAPVVLSRVEPLYPQTAILVRRQGVVVVEAEIDAQGVVRGARAVGPRLGFGLDESAMAAVRAWRFSPARLGSRPVAVYFRLTVRFTLR